MSVTKSLVLVAMSALLCACFSTTAPRKWLPTAVESQQDAFGAWIRVELGDRKTTLAVIEGELIAAHADTVFVMANSSLRAVPADAIRKVTLTRYDSKYGEMVAWSTLGTLATVSHGVILILSMPTWIIVGTSASASASKAPRVESKKPVELRSYARFPQGIPAELDRGTLQPKPFAPPKRARR